MIIQGITVSQAQQALYNDGAGIFIQSGETVYVQGGVTVTNGGLFNNAGTIDVKGDWLNNAGNSAFNPTTTGNVILSGADQLTGGTSLTDFNNLTLSGTGIKSLGNNCAVEGVLDISDRELATKNYYMSVNNTATTAVQRSTGFVSSDLSGFLSRNTAFNMPYLFPVGSSSGTLRYRPVSVTPSAAASNSFSVAMINNNPTLNGFSVLSFSSPVCVVNPNFYHKINRTSGTTPAKLEIFFDNVLDGTYSMITQWQGSSWNPAGTATLVSNTSPALSSLSIANYNNFNTVNFDIAAPGINGLQMISQSGDTLYASTGTAYQWYFNGSIINGATGSYYVPMQTGNYSVAVTTSGSCSVTSAQFYFLYVGIADNPLVSSLNVYPNPFSESFTVEGNSDKESLRLSLTNMMGQEINTPVIISGKGNFKVDINTFNEPGGIYFLEISSEKGNKVYRVVKM